MHPRRVFGAAAVPASAVAAGTMDSSSGSARETPAPLRNVRRGRCFLAMNMRTLPTAKDRCFLVTRLQWRPLLLPHPERLAPHDADDERREPVVFACGIPGDPAHGRHVEVLDAAAERIGQQLFGEG